MLVMFALVCACAETQEPEPRLVPAARLEPESGVIRLTPLDRTHLALSNARCDHESYCDQIAEGRRYATRAECVTAFENLGYDDLRLELCTEEVDNARLFTCLSTIRTAPCAGSVDPTQIPACRATSLCFEQ
jgi:hypothetical protein